MRTNPHLHSYTHLDGADLAERLRVGLGRNFDTWLDTRRMTVNDVWSREIEKAIDKAEVVVALLSSGSFESLSHNASSPRR